MTSAQSREKNRRRPRWRRALIALLLLPIVVLGLYIVVVNAALNLGGLALLFRSTNSINATIGAAWTPWPGRVTVHDLRVTFQDHNLQWSLDIPEAHVKVRLDELISRRFHATEVTGRGARFLMRHRIDPEVKKASWVEALPPIPEFRSPAVFEAYVPEPPIRDEDYNLWTVHLEAVDIGIKEVWVQFVHYRGSGRARGSFELVPARRLWVGPASLDLEPGPLTFAADPLASHLSGRIGCTVHPFDVRVPEGRDVLRYISTDLSLRADGFQVRRLLELFPASPIASASTDGSRVEISAHVSHGRVLPGARSAFTSERLDVMPRAEVADSSIRTSAQGLELEFTQSDGAAGLLRVAASAADIALGDDEGAALGLRTVSGTIETRGDDLAGDWTLGDKHLSVERFALPDVRVIDRIVEPKWRGLRRGTVSGGFSARERAGAVDGRLEAELSHVAFARGSLRADLNATVRAAFWKSAGVNAEAGADAHATVSSGSLAQKKSEHGITRYAASGVRVDARAERDAHGGLRLTANGGVPALRVEQKSPDSPSVVHEVRGLSVRALGRRAQSGRINAEAALRAASAELGRRGSDAPAVRLRAVVASGRATAANARALSGTLRVAAKELAFADGGTSLRVRPDLTMTVTDVDTSAGRGRVEAKLELDDWSGSHEDESGQCSVLSVASARLGLRGSFDESGNQGQLSLDSHGARLLWGDFEARANVRLHATTQDLTQGIDGGKIAFKTTLANASLRSGPGGKIGWDAQIPELNVGGALELASRSFGALDVAAKSLRGRIGNVRVETALSAQIPKATYDISARSLRFDAQLKLEDARVQANRRAVEHWWAQLDLPSSLFVVGENLDLSAPFSAKLRDASPALLILNAKDAIPDWIAGLVPEREIEAEGIVARRCRLTEIQLTHAADGPLAARGRLQSTPDATRGAFVVRYEPLPIISAGIAFDPNDTNVSLFAGDGWLDGERLALRRVAERTLAAPCLVLDKGCRDGEPTRVLEQASRLEPRR